MSGGRPINRDQWPDSGPRRRFLDLLDAVHRANGTKSLSEIAHGMNLRGRSRANDMLRGKVLPAAEDQARALVRALGGSLEDAERGVRLYRQARSSAADDGGAARADRGRRAAELAVLEREAAARQRARLRAAAVPAAKIEALIAWMDGLGDADLLVPAGDLRVLVGPMGAGKTEQAHRWYCCALRAAADDIAMEPPVWLDARQAVPDLRAALIAARGSRAPAGRCCIALDRLNAVGAEHGRQLLDEARQLVIAWPGTEILATTRPGLPMTADEELWAEPRPETRGLELVELLTCAYLPPRLSGPETARSLRSPLSALALAARLAVGQRTDVSQWELLAGLAAQTIQACRTDNSPPSLWPLLMRLACLILDSGAPVPPSQFGSHPDIWQVTDSGLVSQDRAGSLSFVLPVFEQHFGAEALRENAVPVEKVAASAFPRWRYAIAFAVGASHRDDAERLMERLVRANPGAASWILGELRAEAADITPATLARQAAEPSPATGITPAVALGRWLRGAQDAWLDGLHPLGKHLVRHGTDGQPVPWGIWRSGDRMTLAEARESGGPAVTELPVPDPGITLGSGWWRVRQGGVPAGRLGRWRRTQWQLKQELARHLLRGTLPCPPDSPLARERLWLLAQLVTTRRISMGHEPIPTQAVQDAVTEMLARCESAVRAQWQMSGYAVDQDDVRWLHEALGGMDEPELHRPAPCPDQRIGSGGQSWTLYSPPQFSALAEHILKTAVISYRHLVEACFPSFGAALGLYSILPVMVESVIVTNEHPGCGVTLTCVFRPALAAGSSDEPEVRVISKYAGSTYQLQDRRRPDPGSATPALSVQTDNLFELNMARPATHLAYRWLIDDLKTIGWADLGVRCSV